MKQSVQTKNQRFCNISISFHNVGNQYGVEEHEQDIEDSSSKVDKFILEPVNKRPALKPVNNKTVNKKTTRRLSAPDDDEDSVETGVAVGKLVQNPIKKPQKYQCNDFVVPDECGDDFSDEESAAPSKKAKCVPDEDQEDDEEECEIDNEDYSSDSQDSSDSEEEYIPSEDLARAKPSNVPKANVPKSSKVSKANVPKSSKPASSSKKPVIVEEPRIIRVPKTVYVAEEVEDRNPIPQISDRDIFRGSHAYENGYKYSWVPERVVPGHYRRPKRRIHKIDEE